MATGAAALNATDFVMLCSESNSLPEPCCIGGREDSSYALMPPDTVEQNVKLCEEEPYAR